MNVKKLIVYLLICVGTVWYASETYENTTEIKPNNTHAVKTMAAKPMSVPTTDPDTFPNIRDRRGSYYTDTTYHPFDLSDPGAIQQEVRYDPTLKLYVITEKVGGSYYRPPQYMTFEQYLDWSKKKSEREYFAQLNKKSANSADPLADLDLTKELKRREIFGGDQIDIRPQGNID